MKIGIISDLHRQQAKWYYEQEVKNPVHFRAFLESDIIIFAGDMTSSGSYYESREFFDWFSTLNTQAHKIAIAGNHDFFFDANKCSPFTGLSYSEEYIHEFLDQYPKITYLNNSGCVVEGLNIWGSPHSLPFYNWGFMKTENENVEIYSLIPDNTDIVITHGPCFEILDKTNGGLNVGSQILADRISRINPKLHICGHIHEDYGTVKINDTIYVNGSSLDLSYRPINPPIIIEI